MRRILDRSRVEAFCGPTTAYHIVSEIIPWVFFFVTMVLLLVFRHRIPEQIPMNTDLAGHVTGWGGQRELWILCGVYFVINLTLWITGYFPGSWNSGLRVGAIGKRHNRVKNYSLTRDLLCDLRIGASLLFGGLLLWTAFANGAYGFAPPVLVAVCVLVPMIRFGVRMLLHS